MISVFLVNKAKCGRLFLILEESGSLPLFPK